MGIPIPGKWSLYWKRALSITNKRQDIWLRFNMSCVMTETLSGVIWSITLQLYSPSQQHGCCWWWSIRHQDINSRSLTTSEESSKQILLTSKRGATAVNTIVTSATNTTGVSVHQRTGHTVTTPTMSLAHYDNIGEFRHTTSLWARELEIPKPNPNLICINLQMPLNSCNISKLPWHKFTGQFDALNSVYFSTLQKQ